MRAILDSNAVIGLSKGECFETLRSLFEQVWISPGVRREILEAGEGRAGSRELQAGLGMWIREQAPSGKTGGAKTAAMSDEDREVLGLAVELGGVLVTDDLVVRREGERLGLIALGTLETVVLLKQRGILSAVKPALDLMRARGYQVDHASYEEVLRLVGELP